MDNTQSGLWRRFGSLYHSCRCLHGLTGAKPCVAYHPDLAIYANTLDATLRTIIRLQ